MTELKTAFALSERQLIVRAGIQAFLDTLSDHEVLFDHDTDEVVVLRVIVSDDVRGLRSDALCKMLGAIKGNFCWHFATRSDLLVATLELWRRTTTLDVVRSISASDSDLRGQVERLFALPCGKNFPTSARIETSIRDWSPEKPIVASPFMSSRCRRQLRLVR